MEYEVRGLNRESVVHTITLEASDRAGAVRLAADQGLRVLSARQKRQWLQWRSGSSDFALGLFSQELLTLLDSGLSLVESIETLAEKEHRRAKKAVLDQLVVELYQGASLSTALGRFPQVFPPLYVASVKASERTGGLAEALGKYVAYQAQIDVVRKKIVSASIYPIVLTIAGLLVIGFLLGYVVPRFAKIFEDIGGDIPWMSRMLIRWGALVHDHGALMLLAILTLVAAVYYVLSHEDTPARIVRLLTRYPAIEERFRIYQLARFYRALGMLLRGGIPAVPALQLVRDLLPAVFSARLADSTRMIREGRQISVAMETARLTTPVATRMLRVGERTGQMGEMMERIAQFYDAEISQSIDWFVRLFEPLLMAVIGCAIGFIVVVMYFPIFELAGSIR